MTVVAMYSGHTHQVPFPVLSLRSQDEMAKQLVHVHVMPTSVGIMMIANKFGDTCIIMVYTCTSTCIYLHQGMQYRLDTQSEG